MRPSRVAGLLLALGMNAIAQSTWTPVPSGTKLQINSVTWAGNQLVALCEQNSKTFDSLLTSPDGLAWTSRMADENLTAVTWMDTQFVAVGSGVSRRTSGYYRPLAMTSKDGILWKESARDAGCDICTRFLDVVWTGSLLVAVGEIAEISVSKDAKTWSSGFEGGTGYVNKVVWTGTRLVAFGAKNKDGGFPGMDHYLTTSADGQAWSRLGEYTTIIPQSVIWTGTQIVAVGGEFIWRSQDGLVWSTRRIAPGKSLRAVVWTGNRYVALAGGENTTSIFSSQDGSTWTEKPLPTALYGLAWTGKRLVAVGSVGQILVSDEDPVPILRPRPLLARDPVRTDFFTVSGRKFTGSIHPMPIFPHR